MEFQSPAPEMRLKVAHDLSRGTPSRVLSSLGGAAAIARMPVASVAPPGLGLLPPNPRLKPWATFKRCSAAQEPRRAHLNSHPLLIIPTWTGWQPVHTGRWPAPPETSSASVQAYGLALK